MSGFSLYKPFRNFISTFERQDALRTIWAYTSFLQIRDFEIPEDVEVSPQFLRAPVPGMVLPEWQLELIAKEVIINAGAVAKKGKSMREWSTLAKVMNSLKGLEDAIYAHERPARNIMLELNRIVHRQFIWQVHPMKSSALMRYFRIFNTPEISVMCVERTGMSVESLFVCGVAFIGHFISDPAIAIPVVSKIKQLDEVEIGKFTAYCARSLDELKKMLVSQQIFDNRFAYAFNSLRSYPIVRMRWGSEDAFVCPIVTLLFWRITGGLYYALYDAPSFGDAFGKSYQQYVGDVLSRAMTGAGARVIGETRYGPKARQRDSVDWILVQGDFALFLECKSKRLSWNAKMSVDDTVPLEQDIDALALGIVQSYRAIVDYRSGLYPHLPFQPEIGVLPAVVTLENWFMFGSILRDFLMGAVRKHLEVAGLPLEIAQDYPFSVISVAELERGLQHASEIGLKDYWEGKALDKEMKDWNWAGYHQERFGNRLEPKFLFSEEYEDLFKELEEI